MRKNRNKGKWFVKSDIVKFYSPIEVRYKIYNSQMRKLERLLNLTKPRKKRLPRKQKKLLKKIAELQCCSYSALFSSLCYEPELSQLHIRELCKVPPIFPRKFTDCSFEVLKRS